MSERVVDKSFRFGGNILLSKLYCESKEDFPSKHENLGVCVRKKPLKKCGK